MQLSIDVATAPATDKQTKQTDEHQRCLVKANSHYMGWRLMSQSSHYYVYYVIVYC